MDRIVAGSSFNTAYYDITSNNNAEDEEIDYFWGFTVEESLAKSLAIPTSYPVLYISPHLSLLYYQSMTMPVEKDYSAQWLVKEVLKKPLEMIKQLKYRAVGDFYNVTLVYSFEEGRRHVHTKLIIPLDE